LVTAEPEQARKLIAKAGFSVQELDRDHLHVTQLLSSGNLIAEFRHGMKDGKWICEAQVPKQQPEFLPIGLHDPKEL
jgi:hypothetical protein